MAELSPEDRKIQFFMFVNECGEIDDERAELNERRKAVRKRAKAAGFELGDELDMGLKIRKSEDHSLISKSLVRRLGVAAYYNIPVDYQLNLFQAPSSLPAVQQAFDEGLLAALLMKTPTPPYDPTTEQFQGWMSGYHKGVERMNEVKAKVAENEAAEKAAADKTADAATAQTDRPEGEAAPPADPFVGDAPSGESEQQQTTDDDYAPWNDSVHVDPPASALAEEAAERGAAETASPPLGDNEEGDQPEDGGGEEEAAAPRRGRGRKAATRVTSVGDMPHRGTA